MSTSSPTEDDNFQELGYLSFRIPEGWTWCWRRTSGRTWSRFSKRWDDKSFSLEIWKKERINPSIACRFGNSYGHFFLSSLILLYLNVNDFDMKKKKTMRGLTERSIECICSKMFQRRATNILKISAQYFARNEVHWKSGDSTCSCLTWQQQ